MARRAVHEAGLDHHSQLAALEAAEPVPAPFDNVFTAMETLAGCVTLTTAPRLPELTIGEETDPFSSGRR